MSGSASICRKISVLRSPGKAWRNNSICTPAIFRASSRPEGKIFPRSCAICAWITPPCCSGTRNCWSMRSPTSAVIRARPFSPRSSAAALEFLRGNIAASISRKPVTRHKKRIPTGIAVSQCRKNSTSPMGAQFAGPYWYHSASFYTLLRSQGAKNGEKPHF